MVQEWGCKVLVVLEPVAGVPKLETMLIAVVVLPESLYRSGTDGRR